MVRQHGGITTGQIRYGNPNQRVLYLLRIRGSRLLDRLQPHVEANVSGLHRVIGGASLFTGELVPLFDKGTVLVGLDALEVVPGSQVTDQRFGVDTGELFFTHREGNHWNILGRYALITQLLIERHVRITVDGGDDGGLFTRRAELLHIRDNGLPIGMAEWGVVDHDVGSRDALGLQIGFEDLVGGTRVDIVSPEQSPTLDTIGHQIIHSRDGLLIWCGTGVEHILRRFFTFILQRIEEDAVELVHHRQH